LTEDEWRRIGVPTIVTGGVDPTHPTATAERLHDLIPKSRYRDPVVTEAEWNDIFGKGNYPITSDFQGERIGPVWMEFLNSLEESRGHAGV
jgi:hypothetical protein